MTAVYITIDTEYSAGLAARLGAGARREVFDRSIACRTPVGEVGIFHQMEVMDAHGIKGVFFVDPMPALVWGVGAIAAVVEPILLRGHEVQLHLHPEWLEIAGDANPMYGRTGRAMHDFSEEEQVELIGMAREFLIRAGAAAPTAFRAGNYAANDATLRALARCGIRFDSSHVPGIPNSECRISLGRRDRQVVVHHGTSEVPVGSINALLGQRHAQLTAISSWEMRAALRHAAARGVPVLNLVSHSFELMSRERRRANPFLVRRFARLCRDIARLDGVRSATFRSRPPRIGEETGTAHMPISEVRTGLRVAEQVLSNTLYGRS